MFRYTQSIFGSGHGTGLQGNQVDIWIQCLCNGDVIPALPVDICAICPHRRWGLRDIRYISLFIPIAATIVLRICRRSRPGRLRDGCSSGRHKNGGSEGSWDISCGFSERKPRFRRSSDFRAFLSVFVIPFDFRCGLWHSPIPFMIL